MSAFSSHTHRRQRLQQFDALRTMSLRCEILNPKLMKRITSLLMITARMMRVNDEPFEWESLFSWIILCELWPFAVTCLYSYQLSKRRDGAADMKRLHDESVFALSLLSRSLSLSEICERSVESERWFVKTSKDQLEKNAPFKILIENIRLLAVCRKTSQAKNKDC